MLQCHTIARAQHARQLNRQGVIAHVADTPLGSRTGSFSGERMPGRNRNAKVMTEPSRPAPISVVRVPSQVATGPASAYDSGISPIEISHSRLETRPSRRVGTSDCLVVSQTIWLAVSKALNSRHVDRRGG